MAYTAIAPALPDWFFVQDEKQVKQYNFEGPMIFRIAAWAVTEEGRVVGLMGVREHDGGKEGKQTFLQEPDPTCNGYYRHRDDLTKVELDCLNKKLSQPQKITAFIPE